MKAFFSLLSLIGCITLNITAQKSAPVSWTFDIKKINETEYEVIAEAKMNTHWVIYSQYTDDSGPIPTFFTLNDNEEKFEEKSKVIKEYDDMFEVDVMKFKETAIFTKKVSKNNAGKISGSVEYMACDGEKCLPPVEVAFDLKF